MKTSTAKSAHLRALCINEQDFLRELVVAARTSLYATSPHVRKYNQEWASFYGRLWMAERHS